MNIVTAGHPMLLLLAIGTLLLCTSLAAPTLNRLPVSTSMIYLVAGIAAGPMGLGWVDVDLAKDAELVEVLAQIAVLVSLFVTGLKIDSNARWKQWRPALLLSSLTMVISIALLAALAFFTLGLGWALALMMGAILAPTDPVLASDIQVKNLKDQDVLRLSLSGEAGLNDGTAFPFVFLALGLAGLHDIGAHGLRWLWHDVAWSIAAGIAIGSLVGFAIGKAVAWLHGAQVHALQMNEFIAIGVIAVACAASELVGGYSFLAVFAAGVALRKCLANLPPAPTSAISGAALAAEGGVDPDIAPDAPEGSDASCASKKAVADAAPEKKVNTVLEFNGQLERIGEFVLVLLVGAALSHVVWSWEIAVFTVVSLCLVRPISVMVSVPQTALPSAPRRLAAWFGIRGIGSMYYLAFCIEAGVSGQLASTLISATLAVVTTSIVVHGISVTPLMAAYGKRSSGSNRRINRTG